MNFRFFSFACVVAMALVGAACSGGSVSVSGPSDSTDTATSTSPADPGDTDPPSDATPDPADDWVVLEMLSWVPMSAVESDYLYAADLDRAAVAVGIDRPDCATASLDEIIEDVLQLTFPSDRDAPAAFVNAPNLWASLARSDGEGDFRTEFGFGPCETTAYVSGLREPSVFRTSVAHGDVATALGADPTWGSDLRVEAVGDLEYWAWGEDTQANNLDRISPARPIGVGGTLAAVGDDLILKATSEETTQAALVAGVEESGVGSLPHVREAIEALDAAGAYTASLYLAPVFPNLGLLAPDASLDIAEIEAELGAGGLAPYLMLAWGVGYDGTDYYLTLVIAHTDADTAATNIDRFSNIVENGESVSAQSPWSERLVVVDAEVDGRLAVFTLHGVNDDESGFGPTARLLDAVIFRGDSLFWVTDQAE